MYIVTSNARPCNGIIHRRDVDTAKASASAKVYFIFTILYLHTVYMCIYICVCITKLASASWSPSFFSKVLARTPIAWNFTVNYPRAWLVHKQFGGGSIPPGDTVGNIGSIRILCIICIVNRAWFNTFCTFLYYLCADEHPSQHVTAFHHVCVFMPSSLPS